MRIGSCVQIVEVQCVGTHLLYAHVTTYYRQAVKTACEDHAFHVPPKICRQAVQVGQITEHAGQG